MKNILFIQMKLPGQDKVVSDPILGRSITLAEIINFGLSLLFAIGMLASLFFLILGGISWITSGGDKEKLEKSRKTIIFAIIGLIIILLSVIVMNLIGDFLGVRIF